MVELALDEMLGTHAEPDKELRRMVMVGAWALITLSAACKAGSAQSVSAPLPSGAFCLTADAPCYAPVEGHD